MERQSLLLLENFMAKEPTPDEVAKAGVLKALLDGSFAFPVESYFKIKAILKADARRWGLKLHEARFTKPHKNMAFGVADFRFTIPGFKRDNVVKNDQRLGPTWYLTKRSRLVWKVLIPTLDAYLRGHENPIVKRENSGGAFGVDGSMRLDALRRNTFPNFDKAPNSSEWVKLLFEKRSGPRWVRRIEQELRNEVSRV